MIDVQLTSETVVIDGAAGRREAEPGHITNRMRLFVRQTDGARRNTISRIPNSACARPARRDRARQREGSEGPMNLMLFNLSSGEKDTFEPGSQPILGAGRFSARARRRSSSALMLAVIFWLVSHHLVRHGQGSITSGFLAVMFAFPVPVLWWLCGTWDRYRTHPLSPRPQGVHRRNGGGGGGICFDQGGGPGDLDLGVGGKGRGWAGGGIVPGKSVSPRAIKGMVRVLPMGSPPLKARQS